jgi:hypothetical protein
MRLFFFLNALMFCAIAQIFFFAHNALMFLPTWARQGVCTLPKSLLLLGGVTTWKVFLYIGLVPLFFLCAKCANMRQFFYALIALFFFFCANAHFFALKKIYFGNGQISKHSCGKNIYHHIV